MSYELIGYDEYDDAIAGEEYDDYGIAGDGAAGAIEIIGFTDEELDAIAGLEDDLDVLAGYDDGSEVARLLEATAGAVRPPPRRPAVPFRRPVIARPPPPVRRAAAQRVVQTVNNLGRQLHRERARTAQVVNALRRTQAAVPAVVPPPRVAGAPPPRMIPGGDGTQRALVPRAPTRTGLEPIGVNSDGPVPAGQTRMITVRPQVLFRPSKYHISEAVGTNFLINNVTVGKHSQFGTSGALPGTTFSDENLRFAWTTCQPGQDITVTVTNITAADHPFLSTMWGDSVE